MSKRKNNTTLKIVAGTAMTIFTLFSCFVGTYAWFQARQNANNSNDNFEVASLGGKLNKVYFYNFVNETSETVRDQKRSYLNFDAQNPRGSITYDWNTKTGVPSNNPSISLNEYEPLNKENPVLLVFELFDNSEQEGSGFTLNNNTKLILSAKSSVDFFIGERNSDNSPKYNLKDSNIYLDTVQVSEEEEQKTVYRYPLSSVISFSTDIYTSTEFNALKNGNNFKIEKSTDRVHFVDINNNEDTISREFEKELTFFNSNGETHSNIKYVTVILDYYEDAIEYIYSTYLGNEYLEGEFDYYMYFKSDFLFEVI